MMQFDDPFEHLSVSSKDSAFKVRCYSYGYVGAASDAVLKYAVLVDAEQSTLGAHANMVKEGTSLSLDGSTVKRCEFRYKRLAQSMGYKWITCLVMSKDPRILWQDDDEALITAIKKSTETPLLPAWIGYIRRELNSLGLLVKLKGLNPMGSYLTADTKQMDDLVRRGVVSGNLSIQP